MTTAELTVLGDHTPLRVGPELARGGEGAVHTLLDGPDRLLKLYLKPQGDEKIAKLRAMPGLATDALLSVAAWPTKLVADRQGRVRGFLMSRASSSSEAHQLYTPKSRVQAFPEADFLFLLHVAANIVRAFGTVHQAGYVIGDVNHGQVLVGLDGRVTLIDCDSFQVQANGRVYTCDVGVPLFTAPELQGRPFRGLHRTPDHDRFGLAVLLFQMLFMGRHPYAGVPLVVSQSGDLEAAIAADRFAYGADRRARGVDQPPGTLPLSTYGPGVTLLFESAFARRPVTTRPDAVAWLDRLKTLQGSLKLCSASAAHHFPGHLSSCPWCGVEARTGARLFGLRMTAGGARRPLDVAALWSAVAAIPSPPQPAEPSFATVALPKRTSEELARIQRRDLRRVAAVGGAMIVIVTLAAYSHPFWGFFLALLAGWWMWPRPSKERLERRAQAESAAKAAFDAARQQWSEAASGASFAAIRKKCADAKTELERLPAFRAQQLSALKSEAKQRETFLDGFVIRREKIAGIGPGRIAALASFGVETAWDVTAGRVQGIPGFGPATAGKLLAWRAGKERAFRFNPNHPVAISEVNAIEAEIAATSERFASILRSGPLLLQQTSAAAARVLAETEPLLQERWIAWKIAERAHLDS